MVIDRVTCPSPVAHATRDRRHIATIVLDKDGIPSVVQICQGCGCRLTSERNDPRWQEDVLVIREEEELW